MSIRALDSSLIEAPRKKIFGGIMEKVKSKVSNILNRNKTVDISAMHEIDADYTIPTLDNGVSNSAIIAAKKELEEIANKKHTLTDTGVQSIKIGNLRQHADASLYMPSTPVPETPKQLKILSSEEVERREKNRHYIATQKPIDDQIRLWETKGVDILFNRLFDDNVA